MAAAFAVSAKRFGVPTILLCKQADATRYATHFHRIVDISGQATVNPSDVTGCWELKKLCYAYSEEFEHCAFCDADSLVIKNPSPMFRLTEQHAIHTPGARKLADGEKWAHPPGFTGRQIASYVGIKPNAAIHTLNGGFLLWRRSPAALEWFETFSRLFAEIQSLYRSQALPNQGVREELCMALAFALHGIELPRSDASIGVWDAQQLILDIESQQFECKKPRYWEGHRFCPFIAHFGGCEISPTYRKCVAFLQGLDPVVLPIFCASAEAADAG